MKKLLVLAIILRLLVSAFYFHPDIKTYNFQASFFKKGVFNIYSYLIDNKKSLPLKDEFVYLPLTYFVLGGYQTIASPILGSGFDSWLANAGSNSAVRDPYIFKYLLILKLPYLILDILEAFLLIKFFDGEKEKKKAFMIWLFNPFTIVLIYVFGNIDVIPVFLTLVAFLLFKKDKLLAGSLVLGLASGFKMYPILFTPFLFLIGKDLKEKISLVSIPLVVLGFILLPFASQAFVQSALLSGLTTRIFSPGLPIGFNETIIVGLAAMAFLFFQEMQFKNKSNPLKLWASILLAIFAFSHFHIQWLLWIAPFIVILIVRYSKFSWLVFTMACLAFAIPLLYEDRFMTVSLLRIYSTWYDLLPTPFVVIERFYDPYALQGVLHSILAAGSLVFIWGILKKREI